MTDFVIRPHGRLHDWIAHEKGYFREEGLRVSPRGDEARENYGEASRSCDGRVARDSLRRVRDVRAGRRQQGRGALGHQLRLPLDGERSGRAERRAHVGERVFGDAGRDHGARGLADPPARGSRRAEIAVGYRSGSHYTTVQALEPFLKSEDIKLKFGGMPWARVDAGAGWGRAGAHRVGRRVLRVRAARDAEDRRCHRSWADSWCRRSRLRKTSRSTSARSSGRRWISISRPRSTSTTTRKEIPARYRERVDVRLFGPGERVVFLPYSQETFESTQQWIHERDMFDEAPSCDYNAAVVN